MYGAQISYVLLAHCTHPSLERTSLQLLERIGPHWDGTGSFRATSSRRPVVDVICCTLHLVFESDHGAGGNSTVRITVMFCSMHPDSAVMTTASSSSVLHLLLHVGIEYSTRRRPDNLNKPVK